MNIVYFAQLEYSEQRDHLIPMTKRIEKGDVTSGDLFGTRDFLKNNYLYRMAGAALGIYGNTKEEAMYPAYYVDNKGKLAACTERSIFYDYASLLAKRGIVAGKMDRTATEDNKLTVLNLSTEGLRPQFEY